MSSRKPVSDWATDFDYLDPEWTENPYPIWDELRPKCPVAHTERFMGAYLPTRYDDVRAIAQDTEHFSSRRAILRDGRPPVVPSPPLTLDPPAHHSYRAMLRPAFTAEAVKRLEPRTRAICREIIQSLSERRICDAAADYSREIPTRVTARLLGVPEDASGLFQKWIHDFLEAGISNRDLVQRAAAETKAFFEDEVRKHRAAPCDDLITYLINAQIDGRPLSDEDICSIARLLLFAGIDTTWSAISSSLWHLAAHPEDRRRLVDHPELIPTAVEEFLRAYAPVTMAREIVKEAQIGGRSCKPGEMVVMAFPAANRDPAKFSEADRVILDRAPNPHVAFGIGIHRCLGAGLATMEITVALQEWLGAFPDFSLAPGAKMDWSKGPVRGPRHVPVVFGSKAS